MTREILFRGKDIKTGEWIYGDLIHTPNGGMSIVECGTFTVKSSYKVDPNTVGQFTGLKGKNGVEIYEGDIVEYAVQDDGGGWDVCRGSVEFTDCAFQVRLVDGCDFNGSYEFLCDWDKCEVIGNIYEHGDLLNGKQ